VEFLAAATGLTGQVGRILAAEGEAAQFQINLFWVIIAALNFALFLAIMWVIILRPVGRTLAERQARIDQGLKDADAARLERESAADERLATLNEARREAKDILDRAQRVADETRERETEATTAEIERLRNQATSDITAERDRALADVRAEVADLALLAAGKVVGETLTAQRERRLVEEFLADVGSGAKG
jgi:F-type H+-transporting ATPase subunit b